MGEVAERVGQFVTAYSGDLKDESLDGQRVVLGGIVTGSRSVITKAKSTMAVVTLEDLQGTLEVVVFPRTYEQTLGHVARGRDPAGRRPGRPPGRGGVAARRRRVGLGHGRRSAGPEAFAREVGALDRRGGGRRGGPGGRRRGNGYGNGGARPEPVAVGPGQGSRRAAGVGRLADVPRIADGARPDEPDLPRVAPAEPIATYAEPPDLASAALAAGVEEPDEPPLPDEQRNIAAAAAQAPSEPVDASPGAVLNVRFARDAGPSASCPRCRRSRPCCASRPGGTRVVVHVPAPGGSALPMELRGVAYDAELLAEVRRRVGEGVIDISLG